MENQKPAHQRPELPDFWDHRFRNATTPWDAGRVPDDFQSFAALRNERPRTLIPGCGSAWEAGWLKQQAWDVTALDFSAAAIEAARNALGPHQDCLLHGDFFDFDAGEGFDLIYERAFLCALPRKLWSGYGPRCAELLRPGGCIAGYFFFSEEPKGPPFGTGMEELATLLGQHFELQEDRPVTDSIPVFAGKERWQVWRRR